MGYGDQPGDDAQGQLHHDAADVRRRCADADGDRPQRAAPAASQVSTPRRGTTRRTARSPSTSPSAWTTDASGSRCRSSSTRTHSAPRSRFRWSRQQNQYDIDFLFERARKRGYVVFVQEADKKKGDTTSAVLRSVAAGARSLRCAEGARTSLGCIDDRVQAEDQRRPTRSTSVTVRGWNRTHKDAHHPHRDDRRQAAQRSTTTSTGSSTRAGRRKEIVVDEPIFTNCEARERAIAILLDQTKQHRHRRRQGGRPARPARRAAGRRSLTSAPA